MSKDSSAEFFKALCEIKVHSPEPVEYRLHYNDDGDIYLCTMQQHPENTKYLVVDQDIYDNYYQYTVVNGELEKIIIDTGSRVKLKKSKNNKGYCVVKNNAAILVESTEQYTEIEFYE